MKKISDLNVKLLTIGSEESDEKMPTRRAILQSIGNVKAKTADDARRVRRILTKIRDKSSDELILENEDMLFLEHFFEENMLNLPSWMHGQVLELIADAEKVELKEA